MHVKVTAGSPFDLALDGVGYRVAKVKRGDVVAVSDETADSLVRSGLAEATEDEVTVIQEKPKPQPGPKKDKAAKGGTQKKGPAPLGVE